MNQTLQTSPIVFFDTTLRGRRTEPGVAPWHAAEKLRFAHQLAALGVDVLEAGFAIASEGDLASIRAIAKEVRGPRITSLARCKTRRCGSRCARHRGRPPVNRIHVFLATSDLHLQAKLQITRAQALEQLAEHVILARTYADDVEFSAEDATAFRLRVPGRSGQGSRSRGRQKTINLPDTVGYTTPDEYRALFTRMQSEVPDARDIIFSTHCHNDLGMAVCQLARGNRRRRARQVECTVNGIGERAGNAALEEIAAALATRRDKFPYSNKHSHDAALTPPAACSRSSSASAARLIKQSWEPTRSRMSPASTNTVCFANPSDL